MVASVAGLRSSRCDGAHPAEVIKQASPSQWKGPTSRKERKKWGTPIIYDAGEVGYPPKSKAGTTSRASATDRSLRPTRTGVSVPHGAACYSCGVVGPLTFSMVASGVGGVASDRATKKLWSYRLRYMRPAISAALGP